MTVASSTPPHDLTVALSAAVAALRLDVDGEQNGKLALYVELLHRWNAVHNLSSAHDPGSLLQHVIDCLAIVAPLSRELGTGRVQALDAGTGAGLPGVVLAVMQPAWTITAVDTVGKKVAFVRQVAGELSLRNLLPVHGRLEQLVKPQCDLVTSRAFSSLRHLVEQTERLLRPGGLWAAMKGKVPEAEIHELPANCQLFHVEPLTVPGLSADRCLVWLKKQTTPRGASDH